MLICAAKTATETAGMFIQNFVCGQILSLEKLLKKSLRQ